MAKKIVVIGGSAAGPKAASKARRMDQDAEITLIQKGKYLSMASCGYPYFVGGVFDDPNQLISTPTGVPRDPNFFFKVKNIKALVETEVTAINRKQKSVTVKNLANGKQDTITYDKLVIATGANPVVPKLPGIDLQGVTTLQSMEDALYLKERVKAGDVEHAVIVGGGLIGIETCEALALAGIKVTVVEMMDQILQFLDPELAGLVANHLRAQGGEVRLGQAVTEIKGKDGKVSAVRLEDGNELPCSLAVISIGVRPNSKLAADAGLDTGAGGGITVNKFMQTSDPDIYAAGDCVEITNLVTHNKMHWPMGDAANLQARVVGQNIIAGNKVKYEGAVVTGICKVFEYGAGSCGLSQSHAAREGYENAIAALYAAPDKPGFMGAKPLIMKMVADKVTGKLLGMQAVGPGDISKRLAVAAMALHGGMHVSELVNLDLPYAPPYSPAIDNFITLAHVMENKLAGKMDGLNPVEFKQQLDSGKKPFILDVRGPDEYEQMRLGIGETLIPLGKLRSSLDQLPQDKDTEIVTYCKISLRGYEAACFLTAQGYKNVKVLEGGIVAWPFPREK